MDLQYEFDYGVWQEDDSPTLCGDRDDDTSVPGTTFSYRYAILDINQPKGITLCMNSFFDKLVSEIPDEEDHASDFSELACRIYDQIELVREILSFVKAAISNMVARHRHAVQIGAVFITTRSEKPYVSSAASVERLEKLSFEGWLSEKECVICIEVFKGVKDFSIRRMPCQHVFHERCILEWFLRSKSCPMCRYKLSID